MPTLPPSSLLSCWLTVCCIDLCVALCLQFMRHFHALFVKRVHNFKRDLKGLCFLIFIPIIVTLGAIILIKASCTVSDFQ